MPAKFELIAPCFFGCESTANFELRRIGAEDIRVSDGRLTFRGGADMIAAANLNLRTVERVMLLLNTYTATTFDELFDGVYSIHWEELLPADAAFPVTGSSLNSQLSSVPACQSIIKKAVVKRLMQGHRTTSLPETGAEYTLSIRVFAAFSSSSLLPLVATITGSRTMFFALYFTSPAAIASIVSTDDVIPIFTASG